MTVDDLDNFYDQLLTRSLDLQSVELSTMIESDRNHSFIHRRIFDTVVNRDSEIFQFLLNLEKTLESQSKSKKFEKKTRKSQEFIKTIENVVISLSSDEEEISRKLKIIKKKNADEEAVASDSKKSQIKMSLITDKYRDIRLIVQNFNLSRRRCESQCNFYNLSR